MKRTMLLLIISVVPTLILGWINLAEAQQAGKVYRIGYLRFGANPPIGPNHVAFRQRLRELGYVEGENLVIEYVLQKVSPNGASKWPRNWYGSKLMSLSPREHRH